jgi:hypothetical protein
MNTIKYFLGWALSVIFSVRAATIYDNFTIPNSGLGYGSSHLIDKLIRFNLSQRARQEEGKAPGKLEEIHRNFWAKADAYFEETDDRTEEVFIPTNADVVHDLIPLLAEKQIETVCEFGTGDGKWLDYLSQEWTAVSHFIGIDISAYQIEINKQQYPRLKFYQADLVDWAKKHAVPNTLYHTNGGVLEYLSEESVRYLFDIVKKQAAGSLVFLNEPLHGDFDIETDKVSKVIGYEHSYTHNHIHLLQAAGAQILRHEERSVMNYRWLLVVAYFAAEA